MEATDPAPRTLRSDLWRCTPLPEDIEEGLRREVGLLRMRERRRHFPARLSLGTPGADLVAAELAFPLRPEDDMGLLGDVAEALAERLPASVSACWAWLSRPGVPDLHDADVLVRAAAEHGAARTGRGLAGFAVVTRCGWADPQTGRQRRWKRLRLDRSD